MNTRESYEEGHISPLPGFVPCLLSLDYEINVPQHLSQDLNH